MAVVGWASSVRECEDGIQSRMKEGVPSLRQFAPLLLVPVAVALVAIGYEQYAVAEDVFGGTWRPNGSLGLALMVTGLVIGYWAGLTLARPSWGAGLITRFRAVFRRPGRLIIAGLFLGGFGIGLISITATVSTGDSYFVYQPYNVLGLEVSAIGVGLAVVGAWRLFSRSRQQTGS
jgi:hypothetical protein